MILVGSFVALSHIRDDILESVRIQHGVRIQQQPHRSYFPSPWRSWSVRCWSSLSARSCLLDPSVYLVNHSYFLREIDLPSLWCGEWLWSDDSSDILCEMECSKCFSIWDIRRWTDISLWLKLFQPAILHQACNNSVECAHGRTTRGRSQACGSCNCQKHQRCCGSVSLIFFHS